MSLLITLLRSDFQGAIRESQRSLCMGFAYTCKGRGGGHRGLIQLYSTKPESATKIEVTRLNDNKRNKTTKCEGRDSCFESNFSLKNITTYGNLVCKISAMTGGP